VRSLPDGVARALAEYLETSGGNTEKTEEADETRGGNGFNLLGELALESGAENPLQKIGDLCPECGQAALVSEEGCRKCYACGYSEC
jgi:ribonucleoside-diphosphate reductase alpha chain